MPPRFVLPCLLLLAISPLALAGKTPISEAQFSAMIARHTRGRGIFNVQKQDDIACRTGNIYQGARQYDKGGYPTTPPPINFLRQDYTKITPSKNYRSTIDNFTTWGKPHPRDLQKGVTQGSDASWTQGCFGPGRSKCRVMEIRAPGKPLRASRMNACRLNTGYPTTVVTGDHYYRLGSCHAAGRVGKEYEVQGKGADTFLCIDRHYLLFKIALIRTHAIRAQNEAAAKRDPQLRALVHKLRALSHIMEHPSRHSAPWLSGSGAAPSHFFALVKIGGVQIPTPPKWWRQHGKCYRSKDLIACTSPVPTVPTP